MKILLPLAVVAALAGCAGPGAGPRTSHAQASATPDSVATGSAAEQTATKPGGPLYAVLEGADLDVGAGADTVAIVGRDGHAVAKARFQPRRAPQLGNVAVMLQSEAQVGDAGVYYMDGSGVIRLLKPSGDVTTVATFPMTPDQHEAWYAVSPDGSRVLAGILTAPRTGPPVGGTPWPSLVGNWTFDLETAPAGGPTRVLQHIESPDWPGDSWRTIFPVGWTQAGPVAMVGAPLATQNAWWGGPLFSIDDGGQPTTRVGGGDCSAARILPTGLVPCISGGFTAPAVSVRDSSGRVLWSPAVDSFSALGLRLAADGSAIAIGRSAANHTKQVMLPDGFTAEGWLDSETVVGRRSGASLSSVRLDSPATTHDLGFRGDFVGMLPGH